VKVLKHVKTIQAQTHTVALLVVARTIGTFAKMIAVVLMD
jgi:hypothetical protein